MVNRHLAGTISRAELVRAQTAAIVAELQRYQALAGFHSAMGRLQASLGLEPEIRSIQTTSLDAIEREIGVTLDRWYSGGAVRQEMARIDRAERAATTSDMAMPVNEDAAAEPDKQPTAVDD